MIIAIPTNNVNRYSEVPGRTQNAAYVKYVHDAGFTPVLIPMESASNVVAKMADGLLLAGGVDIDPLHYNESNYASFGVDPQKDAAERELFYAFKDIGKPIFGICRGFQLIFRELLYTHEDSDEYNDYFEYIENIGEHSQTSNLKVPRSFPSHQVRANVRALYNLSEEQLEGNSPLQMIAVNSMHHQAVICNFAYALNVLVPGLPKSKNNEPIIQKFLDVDLLAWSMRGITQPTKKLGNRKVPDYDNFYTVVEAARINNWNSPIMGVQWHPEELRDIELIHNFFTRNTVAVG